MLIQGSISIFSVAVLLQALRDAIRGHQSLLEGGRIRHRGISETILLSLCLHIDVHSLWLPRCWGNFWLTSVNGEKDEDGTDIYKPTAGMVHCYVRRNCAKQAGEAVGS